jgi:hypothetical protein
MKPKRTQTFLDSVTADFGTAGVERRVVASSLHSKVMHRMVHIYASDIRATPY